MGQKASSENYQVCEKEIAEGYKRGLFEITPINKTLNKNVLSMAYTPGVGTVCTEIHKNEKLVDELTLRGRSVALITQGNVLKNVRIEPGEMPPILDWCIAQIKYYGNVDCFPFIIRKGANMANVIKDLSNTYSVILILDINFKVDENQIPKDVAFLQQETISKLSNNKSIFDCESTAKMLSFIVNNKIRGILTENLYKEGLKYMPTTFKKDTSYFTLFRDEKSIGEKSIEFHRKFEGKIHIELKFENISQLSKCLSQENLINFVKSRGRKDGYQNISAIVTDGTAILGLGDIGPKAGLPVMEGKSLLFKVLGGVNVVPICINKRKSYKESVEAILDLASYFKAINLEDIKAPDCFEIERELKEKKVLPVFHDDQHGTSIVTLAALINALKVVDKKIGDIKIIITGGGAAGVTICKLLIEYGAKNIIMADTKGAIYTGRKEGMNSEKENIAKITNPQKIHGPVSEIIKGADIFIGVSGPGTLKKEDVKNMNTKPIVFALANPDPEITLDDAMEGGAYIYGSGRSDFKNQINNSLVFPGIFRGIHMHNLPEITDEMKLFTSIVIAENLDRKPSRTHIILDSLDLDIPILIAEGLRKFRPVDAKDNNQVSKL